MFEHKHNFIETVLGQDGLGCFENLYLLSGKFLQSRLLLTIL